jgi:hypothetical protein
MLRRGVLDTTLCDKVPVSSTNKTDHHDIFETLLKVVLNTITITPNPNPNPLTMLDHIYFICFNVSFIIFLDRADNSRIQGKSTELSPR